ncbi:nuclear transport factor 2 family protein [Winogradskyella sp.]|uniref:nuclear transport factor 2 family protein n=1 Tax=Winogradskyella sp. TaxID=1883156 RepID=UPI00261A8471|nr:nuclear transport factor 2 family protein [Winogradskyella sp.]
MTTKEIAEKLVNYCRNHQDEEAYQELYSPEITSIEMQEPMKEVHGFEGIQKKGQWWNENFEVHGVEVSDPLVGDNHFSVRFWMDTTHKPSGQRSQMSEIAVYEVKDGKILKEQFFYDIQQ